MIFTLMKNPSPAAPILPCQPTLCPALPVVLGNVDYRDFEQQLRRIDQLLRASGVEKSFVEQSLARYDQQFPASKNKARARQQQHSYRALRCNVLKGLNRLSLQMTHARRVKDSKKQRKKTLRLMKQQIKVVSGHARRHRELLDQAWAQTDWTRPQAEAGLRRMDGVLALLPQAQRQAHERIIGERRVDNAEKVLSLHETDTRVIVRGKAGGEVEFGNPLLLAEQKDGVIVDWQLHRASAPADARQLSESLQRMERAYGVGRIQALGTDRGFSSAANQTMLQSKGIYDGICPKNPVQLKERMAEERFEQIQRRRSQPEGRIAIFKNGFLGRPLRAKGFEHRDMAVPWQVLTHNLWVLARLEQKQELALAA
jgi:hypothetical protein